MSHRMLYMSPPRIIRQGALSGSLAGKTGTDQRRESPRKSVLPALGLSALFFSLSNIDCGLHNPFEFLYRMDKQDFQLWDSNHKGQKNTRQAEGNLFSSYKQDTQYSFSL